MSEISPSDGHIRQEGQSVPAPLPPPARYLELLAQGHLPAYAATHCGWDPDTDDIPALLRLARATKEWHDLEALLTGKIAGNRPELARAFLAHSSLGAALRLDRESREAAHARDRIRASIALLEHGPLAKVAPVPASPVQINLVVVDAAVVRARLAAQQDPAGP